MVYRSNKAKKKARERKIKKAFFYFFVPIVCLFIGSIFLINADFFSIKKVYFVGEKNVNVLDLEKKIKGHLEKRFFGIYNKKNFLFYPEDLLEEFVLDNEKIKNIDISYRGFDGQIEIKIEEKKPEFLYCVRNDECFFMEKNGQIFTKFDQKESEKKREDYFSFFQNIEKKEKVFLEEKSFKKVEKLILSMGEIDLKVLSLEKRSYDQFVMILKKGTKVIFSLKQDFSKITESLKKISSKSNLRINKNTQDFSTDVIYINVSYGENIFYCMSGEECEKNY
jgi:hypothetical protein